MNLILDSFTRFGLNSRILTEHDFLTICEAEKVTFAEIDKKFSFWANIDGESHIVVSKRWKGKRRLFIMFHELAHHLLHGGLAADQIHFFNSNEGKCEFEANTFATIALCPITVLQGLEEYEEEDRFSGYLRRERERLHFLYRC